MLAELLKAAGEKPYLACHGTGRDAYYLVLVEVTPDEAAAPGAAQGTAAVQLVADGKRRLLPLPLEESMEAGSIQDSLYDAARKRWTDSTSVTRYR